MEAIIRWIDIVSPTLQAIHRDWLRLRVGIMVSVRDYNSFATSPNSEAVAGETLYVTIAADDGSATLRYAGKNLAGIVPECRPGMNLIEIRSPVERSAFVQPFFDVRSSRQPECRRGMNRRDGDGSRYEVLMLPFADAATNVRLIHAVYDPGSLKRSTVQL